MSWAGSSQSSSCAEIVRGPMRVDNAASACLIAWLQHPNGRIDE